MTTEKKNVDNMWFVVVVFFPRGRKESCQSLRQVRLLHDRWRHQLSPLSQFRHRLEGKDIILRQRAPKVSAETAHKTFEPTDLTNTYSLCTKKVFSGVGHRTQALRSGVRCSNHKATHASMSAVNVVSKV
ncbi:hypothetical protein TNCV_735851 [Trichonephila clavipes]|uniref:Uncharacterized protein n=1 Tax=Trichonephila clavipes TaxID=2585209 RepID=A0A8X6SRY8_TRICX|nr:hypothetical protein TNCV_735851 [Trichonephila clavipes]